ncbi:putative cytochrome c oxidase subunit 6b-like [Cajanus cajan]|uniref:Cytochrome c oxidase subunit 6B n=1 Tax=Cajanus cajan TaxID=3821 RepID=A0A151TJ10_CAJCA|nr:putative cytochrome c oxidase subunit 6b-like [Cajanus cajan]KYP67018.1 Cytochrome c oxidase subunit 6B [Cajanus cajan]
MSSAQVDPHDKMRARDVNKVARGEQAPRPAHQYGTVSPPPPTSSANNKKEEEKLQTTDSSSSDYKMRHCYVKYVEYERCITQKGEKAAECEKLGIHLRSFCPTEWIAEWDKEREEGKFPEQI